MNEPLAGILFFPYKCFPPKSVKTGVISLPLSVLSICRVYIQILLVEKTNVKEIKSKMT